ncbi:MAG: hypothetical protein R6U98_08465 [Pirellulaceae bacterium]
MPDQGLKSGAHAAKAEPVPEAATLPVANLANAAHPPLLLEGTQVTLSDGRLHDA